MLWFDIETDGLKPTEIFCVGCIVDNQDFQNVLISFYLLT